MLHVYSYAKVNLFLNVIGKRSNGYHDIQSYFLKLNLADEIYIQPSSKVSCLVEGAIITGENIVLKTIRYFSKICNISKGINIHIKKNIPVAAGLGGGSSNAATILKLLPKLWGVEMSEEQLKDIALEVGADVPFFLYNQNSFVEGIGEILTSIKLGQSFFILLVNPKISILTKNAYQGTTNASFSPKIVFNSQSIIKEILHGKNDLEKYATQNYPVVKELIKEIRHQKNCVASRISGSGPTCFGIFDKEDDVVNAANNLLKSHPNFWTYYEKVMV